MLFVCLISCHGSHRIVSKNSNSTLNDVNFEIQLDTVFSELNDTFCWFHPRIAAIPNHGVNGGTSVIMTVQKHLQAADFFAGMHYMRTDDMGKNWIGPNRIPQLDWKLKSNGNIVSVTDVTPGWHEKSGKLIAIGTQVRYDKDGNQLLDKPQSHKAVYAVFDPKTYEWTSWRALENVPETDSKFYLVDPGCVQWIVKPDGTILLPIYFSSSKLGEASVTVFECSFDGDNMTYLKHFDEISLLEGRGLTEPSIAFFDDRYFLTIRNDFKNYVTASDDGRNWEPLKVWTFDSGEELGSYNTQNHWLVHNEGLFLTYTRKTAYNNHIMRNRAPMFIAQVDPNTLQVNRKSERILIPERGVMLGNFGAAAITENESWVTDAEYIIGLQPHPKGGDGTIWASRVLWSTKNDLKK